ncbi:MAG: hypothetical protein R3F41_02655 [Gammaproteobacteria bacterium]|nr:hypothetical protein [Pseudomonadales bacterium]MCP5345806.1 hypothetical protein [Pseudomonadales bacterium]
MDFSRVDAETDGELLRAGRNPRLLFAVAASLFIHGGVLIALVLVADGDNRLPVRAPLAIRISPLPALTPSEPPEFEQLVNQLEGVTAPVPESLAQDSEPSGNQAKPEARSAPVNNGLLTESQPPIVERAAAPQSDSHPGVPATSESPSLFSLRQAVQQLTSTWERQQGLRQCSPAQRRNLLLDCEREPAAGRDPAVRDRLTLSFNRFDQDDQTRRAMGTINVNRQQLQDSIEAAAIDAATAAYLQQELRQGLEVYENDGNAPLKRLESQIYRNDTTYQQAQRVMNPR